MGGMFQRLAILTGVHGFLSPSTQNDEYRTTLKYVTNISFHILSYSWLTDHHAIQCYVISATDSIITLTTNMFKRVPSLTECTTGFARNIKKIFSGYQLCQLVKFTNVRDRLSHCHQGYDVAVCPDCPTACVQIWEQVFGV
jgi:hypothetical protein